MTMSILYDAIMVRWGNACTEDTPLPVTELLSETVEVVRVPSFHDGRYWWQGATFSRSRDECSVRMDDGRFYQGSAEQVAKYFHEHSDLWQYANGNLDSYVG